MAALVTFTLTVQEPEAGIVPPESATLVPLFAAVTVPPTHVVAPEGDAVFTRFEGYVSVNAAPVIAVVAFALLSVMVSTEVALGAKADGLKAFATVACESTVSDALPAAELDPALDVVTPPMAMLLAYVAGVPLVTFTVTVQEPEAGTVAPESATLVPLFPAVTLPPTQVVAPEGEAVFTRPSGYVSVKAAPVTAVAFGLVSVIVRTLASPVPTELGAKALPTARPESTLKTAVPATALEPAFAEVSDPAEMLLV